ncbi:hypothetical protein [Devosia sp.]|uniref:hypothetical protein n=1 Tax=Devosia sp. TaxID=1871048 RepID=UPI0029318A19|nr:hypothetical protein [Devosia sp.]
MDQKPEEVRAPAHLDRYEKGKSRAVLKRISAAEVLTNEGQTPLLCDLIAIEGRLAKLEVLLGRVTAGGSGGTSISDFLALNTQINATTAMRHKIERRLGL